jgi:hypothetical protein
LALSLILLATLTGCEAEPVNPSFAITPDQAHQAIAQMRAHPRPLPRPLVLVGGFWDFNVSPTLFNSYFKGVTSHPQIIEVSLGTCGSFAECRQKIIAAVDSACPDQDTNFTTEVDVVGASMGGLAARFAAAPSPDASHPRRLKIARLFTISSPHSGAKLAEAMPMNNLVRDMQPGSKFVKTLAAEDAQAKYQLIPYVHLEDEVVGDRYAAPPGQNAFWLPNDSMLLPHSAAMVDDRILADIARRLRDESPFTHFPAAPLPEDAGTSGFCF